MGPRLSKFEPSMLRLSKPQAKGGLTQDFQQEVRVRILSTTTNSPLLHTSTHHTPQTSIPHTRILSPAPSPWPMALARPPNPPNLPNHPQHVVSEDEMDLENAAPTRLPGRPSINPPSSVFLTLLAGIIGNPNKCLADGAATRLSKLEEHFEQLESFEARLSTLEGSRQPPQTSAIPTGT
ncbi:uncharacterized protein VP01_895g4, partial [Puccinia sorghi]